MIWWKEVLCHIPWLLVERVEWTYRICEYPVSNIKTTLLRFLVDVKGVQCPLHSPAFNLATMAYLISCYGSIMLFVLTSQLLWWTVSITSHTLASLHILQENWSFHNPQCTWTPYGMPLLVRLFFLVCHNAGEFSKDCHRAGCQTPFQNQ